MLLSFGCRRRPKRRPHPQDLRRRHILINRDGPAFHPGPRRYSRSWIRDGAMMGAALLRMGCVAEMRDFIRWYARFQTEDGNLRTALTPGQ